MSERQRAPGSRLVRLIGWLVPERRREAWCAEWEAELVYSWSLAGRRRRARRSAWLRCVGALEDALWLRIRERPHGMLGQDLRYALRSFVRSPGLAIVVVATLALGIGANTAIFTLADAVLLRPLPVEDPGDLADVWTTCRRGFAYCSSSYPDYLDYRDRSRTFEDLAAFTSSPAAFADGDGARTVETVLVTGNYFPMLGVGTAAGRLLGPADDQRGRPNQAAVLSYRFWTRQFARNPDVIGETIRLNDVPYTVVGVTAAGFRGTRLASNPDVWIPMQTVYALTGEGAVLRSVTEERGGPRLDRLAERDWRWIEGLIGRRHAGVSIQQARADMVRIGEELEAEFGRLGRTVTTEATRSITLPSADTGADVVRFVVLLASVVGLALLIACANVANLLLARASSRRREIGVRIALGAGRGRLIRQMLTESVLLSGVGAALGVVVAAGALDALSGFALPGFVSIADVGLRLDGRVLAFTALLGMGTGLLFGVAPALQSSRVSVTAALRESERAGSSGSILRLRSVLLAVQTALAVVLLIGAGLFIRSLRNGLATDTGFSTRNLAMVRYDLSQRGYTPEAGQQFTEALARRAAGLPGVTAVSSVTWGPLSRGGSGFFVEIAGYVPGPDEELRIEANWVGPEYFSLMGIPLRGREIGREDRMGAPPVAIINETMANRWFAGTDPIGRTFTMNGGEPVTVIGVAGDVNDGLTVAPQPFVYYPAAQQPGRVAERATTLLVRTDRSPSPLLPALREAVRDLDAELAVLDLATLADRFDDFLMPQRMGTILLGTLGGLTLLLAGLGITGVVGYAIAQRRREIGVRLALGATTAQVLALMARHAIVPVGLGLLAGLTVAAGVTRFTASFMYDVPTTDPVTFTVVPAFMFALAVMAALVPARKAAAVQPMEVLRTE